MEECFFSVVVVVVDVVVFFCDMLLISTSHIQTYRHTIDFALDSEYINLCCLLKENNLNDY